MEGVDWNKVDWAILFFISPMVIIGIGVLDFLWRQRSDEPQDSEHILQRALEALLEARNIERMNGKQGFND
ncbi:hypothetical protein EKL30_00105 [Candidimonas sp. SYP-B2681]|uniref:hypothetical protein n=1 Tax=Candidimonas sp. SYP-B2681 TaxID=2497686 RepID=UPI000F899946|nr:hypothetical protein [Candidimonas sp. SYP-B2681]RTZ47458.1 hypothetical protein EKL30_00105 [Candidimonas sp. SYP-B2681]